MALVAGLSFLSEKRIRLALLFFLFFSAVFTHYANGLQHAQISQNMRAFWWQVSWRVPQFVKGSTIIVNYPNSGNREDSFIWGPANHIYYPYEIEPGRVSAGISAILLNQGSVKKILSREEPSYHKRIIVETIRNYRKFVILTQPSVESCAQVVDRSNPVYSSYETDSVMLVGSYSRPELISLDEEPKTPPSFLFGPEPDHSWCYFYQKADLARQRGEWDNVLKIGEQAFGQGLEPKDLIEWMPFLQAYAIRDNVDRLAELAPVISSDPYISQQACQILSNMPDISSSAKDVVTTYYCGG
jgi:hypothetical protein